MDYLIVNLTPGNNVSFSESFIALLHNNIQDSPVMFMRKE